MRKTILKFNVLIRGLHNPEILIWRPELFPFSLQRTENSNATEIRCINENGKIIEGEIDVVSYSEEYYGCLICTAKANTDDVIAKCDAIMKLSQCFKYAIAQIEIAANN